MGKVKLFLFGFFMVLSLFLIEQKVNATVYIYSINSVTLTDPLLGDQAVMSPFTFSYDNVTNTVFDVNISYDYFTDIGFLSYLYSSTFIPTSGSFLSPNFTFTATGYQGINPGIYIDSLTATIDPNTLVLNKLVLKPGVFPSLDLNSPNNFSITPLEVAVPEPSTYAILAGGIALVAIAASKRKKKAAI